MTASRTPGRRPKRSSFQFSFTSRVTPKRSASSASLGPGSYGVTDRSGAFTSSLRPAPPSRFTAMGALGRASSDIGSRSGRRERGHQTLLQDHHGRAGGRQPPEEVLLERLGRAPPSRDAEGAGQRNKVRLQEVDLVELAE